MDGVGQLHRTRGERCKDGVIADDRDFDGSDRAVGREAGRHSGGQDLQDELSDSERNRKMQSLSRQVARYILPISRPSCATALPPFEILQECECRNVLYFFALRHLFPELSQVEA